VLRALIPWAAALAERCLSEVDPIEESIRAAAFHLHRCYQALAPGCAHDLGTEARLFAAQAVAIEAAMDDPGKWRIKPKMHILLEVALVPGARPATSWCYRDEDFGGTCAALARRRGGLLRAGATSRNMLQRFMLKTAFPRVRE